MYVTIWTLLDQLHRVEKGKMRDGGQERGRGRGQTIERQAAKGHRARIKVMRWRSTRIPGILHQRIRKLQLQHSVELRIRSGGYSRTRYIFTFVTTTTTNDCHHHEGCNSRTRREDNNRHCTTHIWLTLPTIPAALLMGDEFPPPLIDMLVEVEECATRGSARGATKAVHEVKASATRVTGRAEGRTILERG